MEGRASWSGSCVLSIGAMRIVARKEWRVMASELQGRTLLVWLVGLAGLLGAVAAVALAAPAYAVPAGGVMGVGVVGSVWGGLRIRSRNRLRAALDAFAERELGRQR
jgi:hypothetical protein